MIRPMYTKIVVRKDAPPSQTKEGIHIADVAQRPQNTGTVVAVGEGRLCPHAVFTHKFNIPNQGGGDSPSMPAHINKCHVEPLRVKVGDRILFNVYAGAEVAWTPPGATEEEVLHIMDEEEVIGVIE